MPDSRPSVEDDAPIDLVLAVCHEIGNWIGAVRVQAHLLDDEMTPRALARASLEVDALCGRSAALLAHVRPLLAEAPGALGSTEPAALLASVREEMSAQSGRSLPLEIEGGEASDLGPIAFEYEVLHHLLQSLVFAALEATAEGGAVSLVAETSDGAVSLGVVDEGPDDDAAGWRTQTPRGRPLLLAVADTLVSRRGGRLSVERVDGRTRVALVLPTPR